LTGDYAQYGDSFKKAVELKLEEVKAAGGINGKNLELLAMDSKADPKEAANIAQKFADNSQVIAEIGEFTSTAALAAAPIYERNGLVQLSPTSSHPDFATQGKYMFRNIATQEVEGPFLADYAVNTLGKKRVAIIYIQNDWGIVAKDNFAKGVEEHGGEVVAEEKYLPTDGKDFSSILTKIKNTNPDILFLGTMYTDAALISQQRVKAGLNVDIIGTGSLYSDKLLELGGEAVEGLYLASSFFPEDSAPQVKNFVDAYKAKYDEVPNMFAAQAYDAAGLIVEAIKAAGDNPSRQSVRDALLNIQDYPGVTGKTTFDENGDVVKDMVNLVIKDGLYRVFE